MREKAPFTRENLERAYVLRRRESWVETEGRVAEHARDGFQRGFITGMVGMGLAGLTNGSVVVHQNSKTAQERTPSVEDYFSDRVPKTEIAKIRAECKAAGMSLHDRLMERSGWPAIPYDGQLLVTHQDALLMGGKVQATPGFGDHVKFLDRETCETCKTQVCVEICSAEAITPGPAFDREKCVHCGACYWNCDNIEFEAGAGGLHSAEN